MIQRSLKRPIGDHPWILLVREVMFYTARPFYWQQRRSTMGQSVWRQGLLGQAVWFLGYGSCVRANAPKRPMTNANWHAALQFPERCLPLSRLGLALQSQHFETMEISLRPVSTARSPQRYFWHRLE